MNVAIFQPVPARTSTRGHPPSTATVARATVLIVGAIVGVAPLIRAGLSSFDAPAELATHPPTRRAMPFDRILAVSVVSIVPVTVIFPILQRQIISGLVQGAVE